MCPVFKLKAFGHQLAVLETDLFLKKIQSSGAAVVCQALSFDYCHKRHP